MIPLRLGPAPLAGTVRVPPSKSIAHRVLIAAWLAAGRDIQEAGRRTGLDPALSDDIAATWRCLAALQDDALRPRILDCGESGSTLRFLIPLAAALGTPARFVGRGRLPQRPIAAYGTTFAEQKIQMTPSGSDYLPLELTGRLQAGHFQIVGDVSSQYITGLLFALPLLDGDSTLELTTPLASAAYVDLTLGTLRDFGITVLESGTGWRIPGRQRYVFSAKLAVEPDFSQAAFWLVARFLGHDVSVVDLPESSYQGDRAVRPILAALAGSDSVWPGLERGPEGFCLDADEIPDLIPVLSLALALTPGSHRVHNAARLRIKECDRLGASCRMLETLGVRVHEAESEFWIWGRPGPFRGKQAVSASGDHRMAMCWGVAATLCDGPLELDDGSVVTKSYPDFWDDYRRLGGSAVLL
ncbi:MAG: 3-phosphoshikimate 1-carboxyvinyltransferase [Bacillota bacterium]|nr:3-phosphoshikimate 1-carboxyvinyltransferase [Bacillota bacterium]